MAQTRRRGSIGSIGSGSLYLHDGYSPNLRVRSPEEQKLMSMLSQVKQGSQRPFPKGVSNIVAEMGGQVCSTQRDYWTRKLGFIEPIP